ncbi:serine/threonine protein kinase [Streptomyces alfalfae]|uniref:serine/threonine-protein kinase n=1 Tax=Streptomyces alfalfae TaxID=1642299 RepID=UPI0009A1A370|nr:serine/threonine-protein kinase [Streptomyces alfalfae]AYA17198.1 serine/threonine protein kinase [Streptomyces fradiae]RXX37923.1 serine/threonine protein kinase [Streptomyces alfalfae]RZM83202.1 serine/threonine protein kinase [Streptomyces alfalfae]
MSNDGGTPQGPGPYDPTSFDLQPPRRPAVPVQGGGALPGNPYAQPQPESQFPAQPRPTQVAPDRRAEAEPGAGRLIAGRYRLLARLGHGGMGTVWRAKDETVDREVAVKEPRLPDHLSERERANAFERMRREARAAARLDHPAVVKVHDVAVEAGRPWIVMELVRGRSLGAALQEGTLGARDAARIGLDVLNALDAAHGAGILHRDVKPDNVMLGSHDRVVLTDFGIARIEGETNLTDTGGFVGSPEFIAPERVLGQRPGPASDLWSLGVVLYAATEGVSPFRRSNTPATLQSVLNATPAPPASASGPLAEAINRLLAKDPAQRPDAARVRVLLEEAARPPQQPPTQAVTAGGGADRERGKGIFLSRKALAAVAGVVVAAVVAGLLVALDPFGGSDAEGWQKHASKELAATVAAPEGYRKSEDDNKEPKTHWVQYTDPSGSVWISLTLDKKAEDDGGEIAETAAAQMWDDNADFKQSGDIGLGMASEPEPKSDGKETTYQGRKAAGNTVVYSSNDSQNPRPREMRVLYYKTEAGDMYRLMIGYPGKGDFTERGREVAETAIADLELDKL